MLIIPYFILDTCDICGKKISALGRLAVHMAAHLRKAPKPVAMIMCVPCGKSCTLKNFYSKHQKLPKHIQKASNFVCSTCHATLKKWKPAHQKSKLHLGL